MKIYRAGSHWGVTIVESEESEKPDNTGRRPSDRLVGTGQTPEYTALIVRALNHQRKFEDQ